MPILPDLQNLEIDNVERKPINALDEAVDLRGKLAAIHRREDRTLKNTLARYAAERYGVLAAASDAAKAILEAAEKADR